MRTRTAVGLAVLVSLLAVPPSAPVSIDYVDSGSMEPTVGVNDGVVLVPAGQVSEGDIVTFHSEQFGGYVTHRVVDRTEDGFLTKGDANTRTDQAAGHPPVSREEVVGEVLIVGGHPVVVPGLGTVATGLADHRGALLGLLVVTVLVLGRPFADRPSRTPLTYRRLLSTTLLIGLLAATVPILLAGGAFEVPLAAASADAPADAVVFTGGTGTATFKAASNPLLVTVVTVDGAQLIGQTRDGATVELTLAAPAGSVQSETAMVRAYQYPPVLPRQLLAVLQSVHPLLAAAAANAVLIAPIYVLYRIGTRPGVCVHSRWRSLHTEGDR